MTLTHDIPKKNILKNFSMSIHGEGLYRKGLTVTAVCTSCHTAHNVLPHTDPNSTISRLNVVKTCMKCHANIEEAHTKIVRGELWETEPHKVPACVECHGPHQARRVLYEDSLNDLFCLKCHGNPDLKLILANGEEKSLFVNVEDFEHSIHKEKRIACAKCHVNVDHQKNPVCRDSGKVDCSICHAQVVELAADQGFQIVEFEFARPVEQQAASAAAKRAQQHGMLGHPAMQQRLFHQAALQPGFQRFLQDGPQVEDLAQLAEGHGLVGLDILRRQQSPGEYPYPGFEISLAAQCTHGVAASVLVGLRIDQHRESGIQGVLLTDIRVLTQLSVALVEAFLQFGDGLFRP